MKEKVCVGKIIVPHGIRGLVKVQSFTENLEDLFSFKKICNKDFTKQFKIVRQGVAKERFICQVDGIDTVELAEDLRNVELYVERNEFPGIEKGQYYYHDLLNLKVKVVNSDKIGKVVNIDNYGAGEILEISWNDNEKDTDTIPLNEDFVKEINLEKEYLIVLLPETVE